MKLGFRSRKANLEKQLDDRLAEMMANAKTEEEIAAVLALAERRGKLGKTKVTIDPNTVLVVAANLLGIVLIINHERFNVIGSKALSFVLRGRV